VSLSSSAASSRPSTRSRPIEAAIISSRSCARPARSIASRSQRRDAGPLPRLTQWPRIHSERCELWIRHRPAPPPARRPGSRLKRRSVSSLAGSGRERSALRGRPHSLAPREPASHFSAGSVTVATARDAAIATTRFPVPVDPPDLPPVWDHHGSRPAVPAPPDLMVRGSTSATAALAIVGIEHDPHPPGGPTRSLWSLLEADRSLSPPSSSSGARIF
jgi:hypothetical protein